MEQPGISATRQVRPAALGRVLCLLAWLLLSSCGGGGGGGSAFGGGGSSTNQNVWTQGVFKPSADFAAQCAAPRSGNDPPADGKAYPDIQGSTISENNWLRLLDERCALPLVRRSHRRRPPRSIRRRTTSMK